MAKNAESIREFKGSFTGTWDEMRMFQKIHQSRVNSQIFRGHAPRTLMLVVDKEESFERSFSCVVRYQVLREPNRGKLGLDFNGLKVKLKNEAK